MIIHNYIMTKLSETLVKQIVDMIKEGRASINTITDELQISRSSINRWNEHGRHILDKHDGNKQKALNDIWKTYTKGDRKYAIGCVEFVTCIPAAFAAWKGRLEQVVMMEGLQNPEMALRILERWDPPQWAKQVHIKSEIDEKHTITQIVIHGNEEVKQLEERNPIEAEFSEV
jgi:hypothetical protein